MEMKVYFPGNKRVYTDFKGFTVETDQPDYVGGDNSAPAPFELFLASLATCAGIFVLNFMQERGIPTDGAGIVMRTEKDPATKLVGRVEMDINLPAGFPEKYKDAVVRAAELCTVKRHLHQPPEFSIEAKLAGQSPA